ncbi:MAG: hypothetical protein K8I30_17925 [Anaerolineae bacterium]|nr:hypothetical protein [Anaerolineae bacterium]
MTHKIIYYQSAICPRCIATNRRLAELKAAQPEVEIETVEVLAQPGRALRAGVRGLPTIIIGSRRWYHAPSLAELIAALNEPEQPLSQPA